MSGKEVYTDRSSNFYCITHMSAFIVQKGKRVTVKVEKLTLVICGM